jgi:hypothetical protein
MNLNAFKFGLAAAIVAVLCQLVDTLFVILCPKCFVQALHKMLYLVPSDCGCSQVKFSMGIMLEGLAYMIIGSFIFAWAFAVIYNYLIDRK